MQSLSLLRRFHPHPVIERTLRWAIQLSIFVLSGLGAFLLRFDFRIPAEEWIHTAYAIPIWIVVKTIAFRIAHFDDRSWRYISASELINIASLNSLASLISGIAIRVLAPRGFPRSVYFLDFLLCVCATAGVRVLVRLCCETVVPADQTKLSKRVLIYGAGTAGISLLWDVRRTPKLAWKVCGFIDDDPNKRGLLIHQVRVYSSRDLASTAAKKNIEEILIAIPSASGEQMTRILRRCQDVGLTCRTIPGIAEIIEGCGLAHQIRHVAVEDLLGRTPVNLDECAIRQKLDGRVVLITGAAGSIGSELCRQVARFRPKCVVALEISETALFHLQSEMRAQFPDVPFHSEIGNIQDSQRLDEVMDVYRPGLVYHAAAYKHVPMMESHIFQAVENNVFGTYNVALAAARHGVDDFVMISSDKAVRPTSIMGVTKRISEVFMTGFETTGTKYVSVRFGNVLGSNGSVVPIFKKQIADGGPVTVTHPDMCRFFMTIPEAVQLVLQASTMGKGGEIFVLDMGQPVRILDLATNLILLSGLRPGKDIRIEFTGIRPGEKLFEELSGYDENTVPTHHEKIKVLKGSGLSREVINTYLASLRNACDTRSIGDLILVLKEIVPDYNPSSLVLRTCFDKPAVLQSSANLQMATTLG
ncbi:MAG: nucleoside-diphosphate sugar epimerase/dehydratase [Bryobacteraceae bacterium]